MVETVVVDVGKLDKHSARRVAVACDDLRHVDTFNIDEAWRRKHWRTQVIEMFGLPEETAHDWLENELYRQAEATDNRQDSDWLPEVQSLDTVQIQSPSFLWDGRIIAGTITVFDGDGGVGKGLTLLDVAARGSRGDAMPPHNADDCTYDPWATLWITTEESAEFTLAPRAIAAGATLCNLKTMSTFANGDERRPVSLLHDVDRLEAYVTQYSIKLLIIDPFSEFLGEGLSANSDQDCRRVLGPLNDMAQRTGVAIVLVRHLNKSEGSSAQYRGLGSTAPLNAARAAYVVGHDQEDKDCRIIACTKYNVGPKPRSMRFNICTKQVNGVLLPQPYLVWEGECDVSADELTKPDKQAGSKLEEAKQIISDTLQNGPRGSNEVLRACTDAGISKRTCQTARKQIGVVTEKSNFDGQWIMSLPSCNAHMEDEF